MKNLSFLLLLIIGLFMACDEDPMTEPAEKTGTVNLNFKATFEATPLVMFDQVYTYPNGSPLKFQLFNYYVSNITLVKAETQGESSDYLLSEVERIDYRDVYDLAAAEAGKSFTYKDIPEGTYTKIKIGLGLDPASNATQPGDYAAGHPLTENWWSWARGYVFAKIEASADLDGDGQFSDKLTYHIGKNELYTVLELSKPIVVQADNPVELTFNVDLHDVLQNPQGDYLDISEVSNTIDHTNNTAVYGFLWDNFSAAFGIK